MKKIFIEGSLAVLMSISPATESLPVLSPVRAIHPWDYRQMASDFARAAMP